MFFLHQNYLFSSLKNFLRVKYAIAIFSYSKREIVHQCVNIKKTNQCSRGTADENFVADGAVDLAVSRL